MARVTVLCEVVGRYGGTERYWETVLPQLARRHDVRLLARVVEEPDRFGVRAQRIDWSDEDAAPSVEGAERVRDAVEGCDAVVTSNVFDERVLAAVREAAPRWIARVHDYRPFCPNGNKVFPQFPSVCTTSMGTACAVNAVLRGCVRGPRVESMQRITQRMRVRDRLMLADEVLVSSRYVRATCIGNGLPSERIRITPPPLPDEAYSHWFNPASGNAVLFSGRLNDHKGLCSLIRALGRIPKTQRPPLTVAGVGDSREEANARDLARRYGVAVSWRGWLAQAELRAAIDEANVVAVPSLWPEPFGLTGIEAQARGRPVVAYDVGGVADWITGAGIAVPRGDEAALARAIERLTADRACWQEYSRAGREQAERFRLQAHIKMLDGILMAHCALGGKA
jgi:glycosyltransferase involved in cell wall biosynthesis